MSGQLLAIIKLVLKILFIEKEEAVFRFSVVE